MTQTRLAIDNRPASPVAGDSRLRHHHGSEQYTETGSRSVSAVPRKVSAILLNTS